MIEGTISVTSVLPLTPELMTVELNLRESGIRIYPVPAGERLFLAGVNQPVRFKLLHITGTVLFEGQTDHSGIEVGHLPAGMYFLNIEGKGLRFVKE